MNRKALAASWVMCALSLFWSTPAHAAESDVVLYAADAVTLQGNWSRASDATAAGGQVLTSADNGWSSTAAPAASPLHFVEFTFTAAANTPYRFWTRMRAAGNSKFNDSVYAQFSDAVDAGGAALYRIGTTGGLVVNLATDAGASSLQGWGWVDGAYWLTQTSTVQFATAGTRTLRIQTREDGVAIDQVVLSPVTYLLTAPGSVTNDTTIVSRPVAATTQLASAAAPVPGTIEAEQFDNGGNGGAYQDTTPGNAGGAYRQTDVDIETSTENGYDVGWISAGEWLNYAVNVQAAGTYVLDARVASAGQGGTFHVEFLGSDVTGAMTIPNTGGWQVWTTVSKNVTLKAGIQTMRVVFDTAPLGAVGNLNWIRLTPVLNAPPSPAATIVVHASTIPAAALHGSWSVQSDATAAEGVKLTTPDLGVTSLNNALVTPADYVDVTFQPAAATPYRVWLRLKARNNNKFNDAVWVQFSNATVNGSRVYGIGSTSGLLVNLATEASGKSLNGWGWQNGAYWLSQPSTVTFPTSDTQTLRIQVREDGVEFDQIVLSPATYLNTAPGGTTNDSTIVPVGGTEVPPPPPPPPPPTTNPPGGTVWSVPAGGDFQAAINNALPGDTILLEAGATFTGNFVLPAKSGSAYITIRSAAPEASLPGPSTRVTPADASLLPKIKSPNTSPAIATAPGAHHYQLRLLEFPPTYQGYYDIIRLGDGSNAQNSLSLVPYELVLDRVYVRGDPVYGQKRGIALNSASTSIVNSYIAGIRAAGMDSQAIAGWNGPGPYLISNNYLEAAGENVLFGGADPQIPNLVPSDITITRNHLSKPLAWRTETQWTVKNLLELKNAQRVVIDGNLLENNWLAAQTGYAVLFTPRNQNGTAPWTVVQNVQFTNNVVRHVAAGINILGTDNLQPSQQTNGILVRNNLFEDVSGAKYGGQGRWVQLTGGGRDFTFDHNTALQDGWTVVFVDTTVQSMVFTNNIVPDLSWAIIGNGTAPGNATISAYFPYARFLGNVFAGSNAANYPAGNHYPASMTNVGFVNYVPLTGGNYRLALTSLYLGAGNDGKDPGVDVNALNAASGLSY